MSFNIIQHKGDPKQARTTKGQLIIRQEQLFIEEWGTFVKCTPYGEHFIYENPDKSEGASSYLCTCGAAAVVVPPGPQGMFVCLFHATYNQHQTSAVNKKDFEKDIGGTKRVKPARRWE